MQTKSAVCLNVDEHVTQCDLETVENKTAKRKRQHVLMAGGS